MIRSGRRCEITLSLTPEFLSPENSRHPTVTPPLVRTRAEKRSEKPNDRPGEAERPFAFHFIQTACCAFRKLLVCHEQPNEIDAGAEPYPIMAAVSCDRSTVALPSPPRATRLQGGGAKRALAPVKRPLRWRALQATRKELKLRREEESRFFAFPICPLLS